MNFTFKPLSSSHFSYLHKWLNSPHIQKGWQDNTQWTASRIEKKYTSYTENYKLYKNTKKSIYPFIVYLNNFPIGYIQYYDAYDFPREGYKIIGLPLNLAALDFYIGEIEFTQKGLGSLILEEFLTEYIFKNFEYCMVDPDSKNRAAIRCYEKAGFKIWHSILDDSVKVMIQKIRK